MVAKTPKHATDEQIHELHGDHELAAGVHASAQIVPGEAYQPAFDAKRFKSALERRQENRKALIDWLTETMVEGIDFGRIHVIKKDVCPDGKNCTKDHHFSKPSLWKPGAEKICGMLGWLPTFPNLDDYTRMIRAGRPIEKIILVCRIMTGTGAVIGEGIGARSLLQDGSDLNKALKMAKKSAHIDATLVAAGLSEIFTQDYGDDPDEDDEAEHGRKPADPYAASSDHGAEHDRLPRRGRTRIDVKTHCPIGESRGFKGKPWTEVDTGFLDWIVANISDKPEIADVAAAELKRRQNANAEQTGAGEPYDPKRPHLQGSKALADHARAVVTAPSVEECYEAWKAVPAEMQPKLKLSYEERRGKLEKQGKLKRDPAKAAQPEPRQRDVREDFE